MSDREKLIKNVTANAEEEAKKQKLNEAQAKLYIDEEVKKALEEFEAKQKDTKVTTTQVNCNVLSDGNKNVYIVHTPVENYCGEVAGVHFAYGKAEVKQGWILNWFKEHGYRVEEVSK